MSKNGNFHKVTNIRDLFFLFLRSNTFVFTTGTNSRRSRCA